MHFRLVSILEVREIFTKVLFFKRFFSWRSLFDKLTIVFFSFIYLIPPKTGWIYDRKNSAKGDFLVFILHNVLSKISVVFSIRNNDLRIKKIFMQNNDKIQARKYHLQTFAANGLIRNINVYYCVIFICKQLIGHYFRYQKFECHHLNWHWVNPDGFIYEQNNIQWESHIFHINTMFLHGRRLSILFSVLCIHRWIFKYVSKFNVIYFILFLYYVHAKFKYKY